MNRRQNFQTIAWFNDIYRRGILDLDPPYQRRSVWTQGFKDYFVETILLDFPAPTIFLFEDIEDDGRATYHVVDGKQRLTTIVEFVDNKFPISENNALNQFREFFFEDLPTEIKAKFWSYSFSVEYLPTKDESTINNIFDRINRNVAKLSTQELRHAKYSGEFITKVEELSDWMFEYLPPQFPQIAHRSKSQMKDVELVAQLLLRLEKAPKGYNANELDSEFSLRDEYWENKNLISERFKEIITIIKRLIDLDGSSQLVRSRIRNQADFYSLVGAIFKLIELDKLPNIESIYSRLINFVNHELTDDSPEFIVKYYEYARTASNRTLARKEREEILVKLILNDT